MKENFGTCLRFNRLQLSTGAFLKRAVESVDKLRQSLAAGQGLVPDHPTEFYALKAAHSYTLDDFGNGLEWRHSMRRKIRFTKAMQRPLKISRWNDSAEGKSSVGLPPIGVTFNVNRSSKEFTHALKIVDKSAFHVEGDVTFDPVPMEGDEIEYTVVYRGAHLMPIYSDEVSDCKPVQISGQVFKAFDGVIPITPIEVLELEFRFAAAAVGRVQPVFFVGSYSKFIDYLVDSEISRASVRKDEIGENVVIRATVNSALLRHVYGVAWDPPARPESPPVPANSPASG